jgi:Arm DNA-binding domain
MTVIRGGKITPYTWTDADGKRHKSWRWSVNVAGKQQRRQGYSSKSEAETALDQFKAELAAPPTPVEKPAVTPAALAEKYLATTTNRDNLRSREERRVVEHLKSGFGPDTAVTEITASRIADYKAPAPQQVRAHGSRARPGRDQSTAGRAAPHAPARADRVRTDR